MPEVQVADPVPIMTFKQTIYDPIPWIKTLRNDGYCVIRWDKDMVLFSPSDLENSDKYDSTGSGRALG